MSNATPTGAVVKQLDLLKQRQRPFVSIAIPSYTALQKLVARTNKKNPDANIDEVDVVADKITTAVKQQLSATGHDGAIWTLQTPAGADTEVDHVALAIAENLETGDTGDLEALVNISKLQEGIVSMPIRVPESTGKNSQAGSCASAARGTGGSEAKVLSWKAGIERCKNYIPLRKEHVIVYKTSSSSPECTVKTWEEVPEGTIKVFSKCRYAGQPLIDPHATTEERWPAVENGLARLLWRLTGSREGGYDKALRELHRMMQQKAKRIANGHAHLQGDEKAMTLSNSSKDVAVGKHAEAGATWHQRFGALYAKREEAPNMLPSSLAGQLKDADAQAVKAAAAQGVPQTGEGQTAAAAAELAAVAAAAEGATADSNGGQQDVQPEEGAEVDPGLLSPPSGGTPNRRSPRLSAQQQQQQQDMPFVFGAGAAAGGPGPTVPPAGLLPLGGAAAAGRRSERQEQQRQQQNAQDQQGATQGNLQMREAQQVNPAAAAAAAEAFQAALEEAQQYLDTGMQEEDVYEKLLGLGFDGVLAKAVLNNAQPTDQEVRTQGTNKTVVGPLQTDAQRQAARSGRDKETAAAAAAGGKRRSGKQTGGVGSKGGHGRGNTAKQKGGSNKRLRRCVAQVSSDSDEDSDAVCLEDDLGSESDASDLGEGTAAAAAAGGEGGHNYEGVAAAAAGRRANKPPRWRELGY